MDLFTIRAMWLLLIALWGVKIAPYINLLRIQ
jgi:hypothetical protein